MNRIDPMRRLYVGFLTILLLSAGCLGLVGDDVIEPANAEVSAADFQALQTTVSSIETSISTHTTDIMNLKTRVTALEQTSHSAPDLSGLATQASLDAIDAKVTQLESQYSSITQNNNPTSSGNAAPLITFDFIYNEYYEDQFLLYHPDDVSDFLNAGYTDAGVSEIPTWVQCRIYDPENDDIESVGIDYNHDGVTDIDVRVVRDPFLGGFECQSPIDGFAIPISEFNFVAHGTPNVHGQLDSDTAFLVLGIKVIDSAGTIAWDVAWRESSVIRFQPWHAFHFTVEDHASSVSNDDNDNLIRVTVNGPSTIGVGRGGASNQYATPPSYFFTVAISVQSNPMNYNSCEIGTWDGDRCEITNQYNAVQTHDWLEISNGGYIDIAENNAQFCAPAYNSGSCSLSVNIRMYTAVGQYIKSETTSVVVI